jgi:UDPglucose--hexose-1-phosphate uridylyltransferase
VRGVGGEGRHPQRLPNQTSTELHDDLNQLGGGAALHPQPLSPEGSGEQRIVVADDRFTVLCPFAPRFGHETWVLPTAHASHFETITDADALALARTLKRTLAAIDAVLSEPAYNLYVHTAPLHSTPLPHYHWHVEIIPRTARAAGFEWGSGVFINAVPPEQAAAQLRSILTG